MQLYQQHCNSSSDMSIITVLWLDHDNHYTYTQPVGFNTSQSLSLSGDTKMIDLSEDTDGIGDLRDIDVKP